MASNREETLMLNVSKHIRNVDFREVKILRKRLTGTLVSIARKLVI